jgi:hypothetical protein
MPRKQGAIIGLGVPLGAILLFPQGIIPAVLKLAHVRGRIWFLPLYLPKPLQWPACFVMIVLGVAVYCYVLWTMRQLKKSSRELHAGKGSGRSPESALTWIGTGQKLEAAPGMPLRWRAATKGRAVNRLRRMLDDIERLTQRPGQGRSANPLGSTLSRGHRLGLTGYAPAR